MVKKAIYTCIIGAYDELMQPEVVDDSFDYILFVKRGMKTCDKMGVWQVRELEIDGEDNIVLSRFPKMLPHKVLPAYDYSVWMDGNIAIRSSSFYDAINQKIEQGVAYSGVKHPNKDCVYMDIEGCVHVKRDKTSNIFRALKFLLKVKFPTHYGMYENNIILRRNDSEKVQRFGQMWWELYQKYPRRDQFTAPYCLRECGLGFDYLLPEGECAQTSDWLIFREHLAVQKPFLRYWYDYFACRVRTYAFIAYMKLHGVR